MGLMLFKSVDPVVFGIRRMSLSFIHRGICLVVQITLRCSKTKFFIAGLHSFIIEGVSVEGPPADPCLSCRIASLNSS